MSRSEQLGARHEVEIPTGRISYRERGSGRSVVFIHGLLVNGDLWRDVVPTVADAGFRCIVPDLPLGSHETAMHPDADLSPPGLAALIASFLDSLGVDDAVLVANDTGGALTQLVITQHPKRVGAVVLTNCDCFERFFPPNFRYLQLLPKIPGAMVLMSWAIRFRLVQRMPTAFGSLTHAPISREAMASYIGQARNPAIRRDVTKVLRGVDKRHTLAAAEELKQFDRPALLAWGVDDRNFRLADGERLRDAFPQARLEPITGAKTFVPEDQPATLAHLIVDFAR
jgi:pimeloyl-ACP methyl ester carboxylesterase